MSVVWSIILVYQLQMKHLGQGVCNSLQCGWWLKICKIFNDYRTHLGFMFTFQEMISTVTAVLDGGQDVCGDAEPTGLTRNMSNTLEARTQTDPTPCTCTHPVMRCVEVATDDVDFAATIHHDHPYCTADPNKHYAIGLNQPASEKSITNTEQYLSRIESEPTKDTVAGDEVNETDETSILLDDDTKDVEYVPHSPHSFSSGDSDSGSGSDSGDECDDLVKEEKFIVYKSKLLPLFSTCRHPGCGKPTIETPTMFTCGFAVGVTTYCIDGHTFTWHSQPKIGSIFAGNIAIPSALFITGNSYSTFAETCECLSLQALSSRQCYNIQWCYVIPEVNKAWSKHNESVLATLAGEELTLSGDARCDSPGHSASFGTYTLLDSASHMIVFQETVHVSEVKNSYWMELAGLERCLETISDHNVFTKVLATDRHPGIQKMLRDSHKEIKHEYDLWHIQKGVKKKLINCKIPELLVWVLAIVNHLWYLRSYL